MKVINSDARKIAKDASLELAYQNLASLDEQTVFDDFQSKKEGISAEEAEHKLQEEGKNVISDSKQQSWSLFLLKDH